MKKNHDLRCARKNAVSFFRVERGRVGAFRVSIVQHKVRLFGDGARAQLHTDAGLVIVGRMV